MQQPLGVLMINWSLLLLFPFIAVTLSYFIEVRKSQAFNFLICLKKKQKQKPKNLDLLDLLFIFVKFYCR